MLRRLRLLGLMTLLLASLAATWQAAREIHDNPALRPIIARSAAEYRAATDRALAQTATTGHMAGLLSARLAESPRNWLALDALLAVAAERGLPLHPTVIDRIEAARAADTSYLSLATECAQCVVDAASCSLNTALICNAPVTLSPVGDVIGLGRQGVNYLTGTEVDDLDLALSAIGLGATALALASGGSSVPLKLGASLLRLSRKMGVMTPALARSLTHMGAAAFDLRALRSGKISDLRHVLRVDAFRPLGAMVQDLATVQTRVGTKGTLHLLTHVDDATDARRLARSAEVLGAKTIGRAEVLGKTRLFRLGLRLSDLTLHLFAGLAGLLAAVTALAAGLAQSLALRMARGLLR